MNYVKNFLKSRGLGFVSLFDWFASAWKKLSTTEKDAAVKASGIIAIINANLTATPDIVFQLIQIKFPDITKEKLTSYLSTITSTIKDVDGVVNADFATTLSNLQSYLGKYSGNQWVTITQGVVGLLAGLLAPSTPIQKITLVLEYVYQNFIKGKIA